jgi:voltage-gated potassium channel
LHLLQILLWAAFYRLRCFRSWESCFYFSATSYSTVGYGDIVLPPVWRLLGPVEAIMGVLMCGISVSALFAIATRLIGNETQLGRSPIAADTENSAGSGQASSISIRQKDPQLA